MNKPNTFGSSTGNNIFNNNNTTGASFLNNNNNAGQTNIFNKNNNVGQGNPTGNFFNNNQGTNNLANNTPTIGNNMFNNANQGNNPFPATGANQTNNAFQQNNQQNSFFNKGPQANVFNQGAQGNAFNQGGQNNIFNKGAQGNAFNQGNQGNVFNQGGQTNMFNNQGGNQQQGNFLNQGQQGNQVGNVFNQGGQQGNMFNQNPQQNNMQPNFVNQNGQQNTFNQGQSPNFQNIFYQQMPNLLNYTPQQQQQIIRGMSNDQIRKFIENCLKNLPDPKIFQNIKLPQTNALRNEKINKVATTYNIKQQILFLKKQSRDKIVNPISDLKSKAKSMANATAELAYKVSEKLQKYKQKLIETITQKKMIEDVNKQVNEIESHINLFIKPLFNSYESKTSFSFIDPDQFCLRVAEKILKNISNLDNKMDELLACQGDFSQQIADTGDIIEQLVVYYENVVILLREFAEKYATQKKKIFEKQRMGNTEQTMRNIVKKANSEVIKQLKVYELVKQIENILVKREKNSKMNEQ